MQCKTQNILVTWQGARSFLNLFLNADLIISDLKCVYTHRSDSIGPQWSMIIFQTELTKDSKHRLRLNTSWLRSPRNRFLLTLFGLSTLAKVTDSTILSYYLSNDSLHSVWFCESIYINSVGLTEPLTTLLLVQYYEYSFLCLQILQGSLLMRCHYCGSC